MSDVQVIGLPQSNYVWAVRIALAEKGVEHENLPAAPHSPEAVAVHPMGKIPVLRHGAVALGESRAIIDYIDATFDGSPLVPGRTRRRAAQRYLDVDRRDLDRTAARAPIPLCLHVPGHG